MKLMKDSVEIQNRDGECRKGQKEPRHIVYKIWERFFQIGFTVPTLRCLILKIIDDGFCLRVSPRL